MCDYCNKDKSFGNRAIIDDKNFDVFIVSGALKILDKNNKNCSGVGIEFCPICGERLEQN